MEMSMNARRRAAKIESSELIAVFICRLVFRHSLSEQFMQIVAACNDVFASWLVGFVALQHTRPVQGRNTLNRGVAVGLASSLYLGPRRWHKEK
jgi:hypothetical protein